MLDWLHPERDQAGLKYEAVRQRLIKIFTCRGCPEAEDLADDTINRVITKIDDVAPNYTGDPALFFYGVARNVLHEHQRSKTRAAAAPPITVTPAEVEETEREYECLERCMQTLSAEQRELVLQYYQESKRAKIDHRKDLAERFGIAMNALRIRAHRLRASLQRCVEDCLERAETI